MLNPSILTGFKSYLLAVKHNKVSTAQNHIYEIGILLDFFGQKGVEPHWSELDPAEYLSFRFTGKDYKRTYTNKIMSRLQTFYEYLVDEGKITAIPGWIFERAEAEKRIPNILSMYELHLIEKQFCSSVRDLRDAAILEALLSTGLRISELLRLTVADYKNEITKAQTKGDKERFTIFNQAARTKIDRYLKARSGHSLLLFCNANGNKLSTSYIDKTLIRVCGAAGIKRRISAHSLRHTYASLLYEGGANLIEIRDLLGHASVTTTEIYARLGAHHLRAEMARAHPRW